MKICFVFQKNFTLLTEKMQHTLFLYCCKRVDAHKHQLSAPYKFTVFLLVLSLWSQSQPSIWQLSCCKGDWDVSCRRLRTWSEKLSAGADIILDNEKSYSKTQRHVTKKTCAKQRGEVWVYLQAGIAENARAELCEFLLCCSIWQI